MRAKRPVTNMNDENGIRTPYDILSEVDGLDPARKRRAETLLDRWGGWQFGKPPTVSAAVAYYYANRLDPKVSQRTVSDLFGVSEESFRNYRDEIMDRFGHSGLAEIFESESESEDDGDDESTDDN